MSDCVARVSPGRAALGSADWHWVITRLRARLAQAHDPNSRPLLAGLVSQTDGAALSQWQADLSAPPKLAAVLVLILMDRPIPTLLLIQRALDLKQHAGQIAFPGGRVEAVDRSREATALREAAEECGVIAERVRILGYLPDCVVRTGYRITPVVGVCDNSPPWRVDGREAVALLELPLSLLLTENAWQAPVLTGTAVRLWELPFAGHRIWGATAGILRLLAQTLGE